MAEKIDHLAGLSDRLTSYAASHHSAQRHLLPHQHPELVGGPVGLGVGDVGDKADQVESGVSGRPHVGGDLVRCRIARAWGSGQHHDALGEETNPVHVECPVAEPDRAEGRAAGPMIVHLAVDDELTREFVQGLLAE